MAIQTWPNIKWWEQMWYLHFIQKPCLQQPRFWTNTGFQSLWNMTSQCHTLQQSATSDNVWLHRILWLATENFWDLSTIAPSSAIAVTTIYVKGFPLLTLFFCFCFQKLTRTIFSQKHFLLINNTETNNYYCSKKMQ